MQGNRSKYSNNQATYLNPVVLPAAFVWYEVLNTVSFTVPPVSVGCTVVCTVLVGVGAEAMGPPGLLDVIDEFAPDVVPPTLEAVEEPAPAGPVGVSTETDEELVEEVVFEITLLSMKDGEVSETGP